MNLDISKIVASFPELQSIDTKTLESYSSDVFLSLLNLINTPIERGALVIKSESLIALMNFYQILITTQDYKACEIVRSENQFYGLLEGFALSENESYSLEWTWYQPGESLNNIYNR